MENIGLRGSGDFEVENLATIIYVHLSLLGLKKAELQYFLDGFLSFGDKMGFGRKMVDSCLSCGCLFFRILVLKDFARTLSFRKGVMHIFQCKVETGEWKCYSRNDFGPKKLNSVCWYF